jgi:DNA-binding transcriptional MerR regulator
VPQGPEDKPELAHLKPRYSESRVLKIFNISKSTLRRWEREGLITPVRLGPRKVEFEVDEVERRYRQCRKNSA